jgi:hypothetical protein
MMMPACGMALHRASFRYSWKVYLNSTFTFAGSALATFAYGLRPRWESTGGCKDIVLLGVGLERPGCLLRTGCWYLLISIIIFTNEMGDN